MKTINIDVRIVAHQAAVIGDQFYWAAGMLETTRRQLRSINITMQQHSTTRPLASPRPDTDAGTVTYQPQRPHVPVCPVCPRCVWRVSPPRLVQDQDDITSHHPPRPLTGPGAAVQHIPLLQCNVQLTNTEVHVKCLALLCKTFYIVPSLPSYDMVYMTRSVEVLPQTAH